MSQASRGKLVRKPPSSVAKKDEKILVPKGYRARPVKEAANYDVISVARAMNDDFGGRVKKLFDPEREAAMEAQTTDLYVAWRCPEFTWDCQRVNKSARCFCNHPLDKHKEFTGGRSLLPCHECSCRAFTWVPSRPEDIGEFWFQRRRDFVVEDWRAKCRCKHTHDKHEPSGLRACRAKGCGCGVFSSDFLCAACDRHWEDHETFFETKKERQAKGLPTGADYMPFGEIPSLRNMVLTGKDDGDNSYVSRNPGPYAALGPRSVPQISSGSEGADNNTAVPFGNSKKSGFRPVYD